MWIPDYDYSESWKLEDGEFLSIMTAEMHAIMKALEWVAMNMPFLVKKEIVILTDSLSSLQTLDTPSNANNQRLVNRVLNTARILTDNPDDNLSIALH